MKEHKWKLQDLTLSIYRTPYINPQAYKSTDRAVTNWVAQTSHQLTNWAPFLNSTRNHTHPGGVI